MAFTASKTSAKQTGFNVGATVVAALTTAGIIETQEEAVDLLFSTAEDVYQNLQGLVDEDNASAPKKQWSGGTKGGQSNATAINPGDQVFNWGKKNGQSIQQVFESDPSYLTWLTEKDTNPARNFMRKNAEAYLDSVKAGV